MGAITQFRGQYGFLSNFAASPFDLYAALTDSPHWADLHASWAPVAHPESVWAQHVPTAQTVEHAFQAAKCATWKAMTHVLEADTPGEAKRRGRQATLRPDWELVKVAVMLACLRAKFAPGSHLARALLDTGNATLVEGNTWGDRYWGAVHEPLPHVGQVLGWNGRNMLGRCLMLVRAELDVYATTSTPWRA